MDINLKISKKTFNEVYLKTWNVNCKLNIFYGGSGSGKSEYVFAKNIIQLINDPGRNLLITRKVANTIEMSVFNLCIKILKRYLGNQYENVINAIKSPYKITFPNGNQILFAGLDDHDKLKSITPQQGNITNVIMEEISECDKEDYNQITTRIRGRSKYKKQIYLLLNPIDQDHWVKKDIIDKNFNDIILGELNINNDVLIFKTIYKHNKYLTEDDIQRLMDLKSEPYWYSVYVSAEWGMLKSERSVIDYKYIVEARQLVNPLEIGTLEIGVDVARFGDDTSVIYYKKGNKVFRPEQYENIDGTELAYNVINIINRFKRNDNPLTCNVKIDLTGVGSSPFDSLRRMQRENKIDKYVNIIGVNNHQEAKDKNTYSNAITEAYFETADIIKEGKTQLPECFRTYSEFAGRFYSFDSQGRKILEKKDDYKKRKKKSPDFADSFVLMFYNPNNFKFGIAGTPISIKRR